MNRRLARTIAVTLTVALLAVLGALAASGASTATPPTSPPTSPPTTPTKPTKPAKPAKPAPTTTTPSPATPAPSSTISTIVDDDSLPDNSTTTTSLVVIQETSESPDSGVIAVTTDSSDPPSWATQEVESSFEGSTIAPDKIVAIASLNPQQGLLVSFSTAVQTFNTHLLTVLALGLLGVSLFFVDLTRDDQAKGPEGVPRTPGGWWFSS